MYNPKSLLAWQKLNAMKSRPPEHFVTSIIDNYLEVELSNQYFCAEMIGIFNDLLQEQGFWEARTHFIESPQEGNFYPSYMHLRNLDGHDVPKVLQVKEDLDWIKTYSEKIRQGHFYGFSGQKITDVVNIGMGGSDLGPRLCVTALEQYKSTEINLHFISDADNFAFNHCLANLNPETTLFIVSSKSFQTKETLVNVEKVVSWCGNPEALQTQFIAITANAHQAKKMGYQHVCAIPNWVTGRYSSCSAINLITAIMIGYDAFLQFIKGAYLMDKHFLTAPIEANAPMMMAIQGVWNINFLNIPTHALLLYDTRLRHFIDYVQQMDMESNGKSADKENKCIDYATAPIVWGGLGNQAHHSYFQLLLQGSHQIAVDFLSIDKASHTLMNDLCESRKNILKKGQFQKSSPKNLYKLKSLSIMFI